MTLKNQTATEKDDYQKYGIKQGQRKLANQYLFWHTVMGNLSKDGCG